MLTKEEYEKAVAELDAMYIKLCNETRGLTPEECARWDELSDAIDAYEKEHEGA